MTDTTKIPAGLWLSLFADQQMERAVIDGFKEIVKAYYREFSDATSLEPDMITHLQWVYDTVLVMEMDFTDMVREAEAEIADIGGSVYLDSQRRRRTIQTFSPDED